MDGLRGSILPLQVGSNTMNNSNDPLISSLEKYGAYRKIFVKSIPPLFEQLQKNLAHLPDATFVNAAFSSAGQGDLSHVVCFLDSLSFLKMQKISGNADIYIPLSASMIGIYVTSRQRKAENVLSRHGRGRCHNR